MPPWSSGKRLDCYAKGPGFKTHSGPFRKIYFYQNFVLFWSFFKNETLPEKMYISQTHFGFTNMRSKEHRFCLKAVWIRKFWSWTPCIGSKVIKFLGFINYPNLSNNSWFFRCQYWTTELDTKHGLWPSFENSDQQTTQR